MEQMGVAHKSPLTVGCDMTFWGWTNLYKESHPIKELPHSISGIHVITVLGELK